MRTVSDIIDKLGGATVVADLLGLKAATTAASWKQRNSIPVEHWSKLVEASRDVDELRDLSYGELVALHTPVPTEMAQS